MVSRESHSFLNMQTKTIDTSDSSNSIEDIIAPAIESLKRGEPVGIPTETVYGLAANALSFEAVQKIFEVKGRPSDNPLIVHISSLKMLPQLLDNSYTPTKVYSLSDIMALIPISYHAVITKHWPGPLSILLPTSSRVPKNVTAGLSTVAVRFPKHPIAQKVIESCGFPLAAPSANTSGRPSPTLASHVHDDLNGRISFIIDGGLCNSGVESTVLDALGPLPCILRPGGVTFEDLKCLKGMEGLRVYKKDFVCESMESNPTTPGMKYTHYKPDADVYLVESNNGTTFADAKACQEIYEIMSPHSRVGAMGSDSFVRYIEKRALSVPVTSYSYTDNIEYAKGLFKGFRDLEVLEVKIIFVEAVPEEYEGMAIMNRLRKAAVNTIFV